MCTSVLKATLIDQAKKTSSRVAKGSSKRSNGEIDTMEHSHAG